MAFCSSTIARISSRISAAISSIAISDSWVMMRRPALPNRHSRKGDTDSRRQPQYGPKLAFPRANYQLRTPRKRALHTDHS